MQTGERSSKCSSFEAYWDLWWFLFWLAFASMQLDVTSVKGICWTENTFNVSHSHLRASEFQTSKALLNNIAHQMRAGFINHRCNQKSLEVNHISFCAIFFWTKAQICLYEEKIVLFITRLKKLSKEEHAITGTTQFKDHERSYLQLCIIRNVLRLC